MIGRKASPDTPTMPPLPAEGVAAFIDEQVARFDALHSRFNEACDPTVSGVPPLTLLI